MTTTQRSITVYSVAAAILAIPFIAMQFTDEVKWDLRDFLIIGVLLFGTATVINFILQKVQMRSKQFILIAIALLVLFLIWAELAVGIFGSPFAGS